MDMCPHCNEFLEKCPCCGECFCPLCRMTEEELEDENDEEGEGST